jgi:hypothetical protein
MQDCYLECLVRGFTFRGRGHEGRGGWSFQFFQYMILELYWKTYIGTTIGLKNWGKNQEQLVDS